MLELLKPVLAGVITVGVIFTLIMLVRPYVSVPGGLEKILLVIGGLFPFAQTMWEKYLASTGVDQGQIKDISLKLDRITIELDKRLDLMEQRILKLEMVTGNMNLAEITEGRRLDEQHIEKIYDITRSNTARIEEIEKTLPTKLN